MDRKSPSLMRTIFSYEMLFTQLLFSGLIKTTPLANLIHIDLTALLSGAVILLAALFYLERPRTMTYLAKPALIPWLLLILLFCYFTFSLAWTNNHVYGIKKIALTWFRVALPVTAAALIIVPEHSRTRNLINCLLLTASIWLTYALVYHTLHPSTHVVIFDHGTSYQNLAAILSLGATISTGRAFQKKKSGKIACASLAALFFYGLLVTGGKAGLVAYIFSMLPLLFIINSSTQQLGFNKIWLTMLFAAAILMPPLISSLASMSSEDKSLLPVTVQRLVAIHPGGKGQGEYATSYTDRIQMWELTVKKIIPSHFFFGGGSGSWPIDAGASNPATYPHNLMLEIFSEYGVVGFLLIIFFLTYCLNSLKLKPHNESTIFLGLFLNRALVSSVNGSLPNAFLLFTFSIMLTLGCYRKKSTDSL